MKIALLLFAAFEISSYQVNAQYLTSKEVWNMHAVLSNFLKTRDSPRPENGTRNSELIIMFLETDSNNKVCKIHLLADEKNKDSTYAILSRMTIEDFEKWHSENCKNKIILIPVYSSGQVSEKQDSLVKNNYADTFFGDLLWAIQRPSKTLKEQGDIILINPFNYPTPGRNTIHPATNVEFRPIPKEY